MSPPAHGHLPPERQSGQSRQGAQRQAAAAYRAATQILDERTGLLHDYRQKHGVAHTEILAPDDSPSWARERDRLWNEAEQAESRKNSTVAREFEVALPDELTPGQRLTLARDLANQIVVRHRCAVDIAIHAPNRAGDERNHHAHLLLSTRRLTESGFTEKTRELDDLKTGEVMYWRERWAGIVNEHLARHGHESRLDHRSLDDQGETREATQHLGPMHSGMERRGIRTEVGWRMREEANERLQVAAELGLIERERQDIERSLLDLSSDVAAARHDRDAGLIPQPDLESQRRAGREAWLAWRANSQDQLEHERTTHVHRSNQQELDDDLGIG